MRPTPWPCWNGCEGIAACIERTGTLGMSFESIIANFQTFHLADLLDIIIIAFLIYQLLGDRKSVV